MKPSRFKSWLGSIFPSATFSTSSYPFPPGSQNRDGFERNADNPLKLWFPDNAHRALTRSTVMACVRIIAGTISTLPCFVYERGADGKRTLAPEHELYGLLHDSPNDDMTAKAFWKAVVASMLLNGEAYGEQKIVESTNRMASIEYLEFERMSWRIVNGDRVYSYTDSSGRTRVIPRDRLFRVVGFTLNGLDGISAIRYGAMMFNSAELADVAANAVFRKGLQPTVAFSTDKILREDQRNEMRSAIRKLGGALNAGEPIVLEGGMSASNLGINPDDAQLLESRAWSVEEICRWFGVPPFMVGHSEKSTSWGSGLEQQNQGFLTYCLSDHIKGIEQAISKDLISPSSRRRIFAEFELSALLRADSAGRAQIHSTYVQNGIYSRKYVQQLENLPVRDEADQLTVQSALIPLEDLGAQSDPATDLQKSLRNFLGLVTDDRNRPDRSAP